MTFAFNTDIIYIVWRKGVFALEELKKQTKSAIKELFEISCVKKGQILVVGCSSSEISGQKIGSDSRPEVAYEVFSAIKEIANKNGVYVAAQCCEHLNRALIVERELAEKKGLEIVNVMPVPKAGGSFATAAYSGFTDPVAVEYIKADLGIDIGLTMIGMHLKDVAVPVRLSVKRIGDAIVSAARTRPKYIGGPRANYKGNER